MTQGTNRTVGALREAVPALSLLGDPATPVTGVACNTLLGDVRPGVLFAPLDMPEPQIATVAARAVSQGAAALLLERPLDIPVPQLIVPQTRPALARVSASFFDAPACHLGCIGVTGTDGKTTTSFLIDAILRASGISSGMISSAAVRVDQQLRYHPALATHSTPEAPYVQRLLRRMVDAGSRWAVLEATSHGLALHRLDEIPFAVGAVTFISQDHLGFHGSVAAYRRAKAILFERVAETGGVAVINADDPAARGMIDYVGASRVLTYSAAGRETDVRATSIDLGPSGTRFTLVTPFGEASVVLPLLGEFNVANALCAAAVAAAIEIPLADVVRGLETATPVPGLLEPVDAGQPFKVLVDEAKSATHLTIALEVARRVAAEGRVIVLVGGSDYSSGDELRRKGQVATFVADYAVFTSQDPGLADPNALVAQIAQGAKAVGGRRGKTFACVADRHEAIRRALSAARPGDCVLLVGKGAEDVQRIRGEKRPWDESKIALAALADLGFGTSPHAVGPDIADG